MRRNCWNNPNTNLEGVGKGTRAFPFLHYASYFRVSWAAVRPSMQAHPSRHSGLDPESWAACAWYCAVPVSSLSETLHATSLPSAPLYHRAPLHSHRTPTMSFACAPIGLRFGHPCKHTPLVIPGLTRNLGRLVRGVVLCRCHRYRRRCTQRPYHPRRCTIALSAQPPVLSSSVIPASEPESWVACAWCCAVPVSSLSETLHATSLPSAPAASQDPVSAHCAAVPRMETP